MKIQKKADSKAKRELYKLILEKLFRSHLLKQSVSLEDLLPTSSMPEDEISQTIDNQLVQLLVPRITALLDRSLFDLYQVLYQIDVSEEEIKAKIMDLENTAMIPSIIAFSILDRLKERYANYPLLKN